MSEGEPGMDGGVASRVERKYVFSAEAPVLHWMEHCLIPEPGFPQGRIYSLYYDTPTLARYREKLDGERSRSKVRLRWYADSETGNETRKVDCYLEAKSREGALTRKSRVLLRLPRDELLGDLFGEGPVRDLPLRHAHTAPEAGGDLRPVLLLRYERRRFIDPTTGARVSVDTAIVCDRADPVLLPPGSGDRLGIGVLEIKGERREKPAWLEPLSGQVAPRSFSKYAVSVERLLARS